MVADVAFALHPDAERVLTPDAVDFLVELHRRFEQGRRRLLEARVQRQARFDAGDRPDFSADTEEIRAADWVVPEAPKALSNRRVEITGPVDRKMMINALNSGAQVFMADLEDANSPTWGNVVTGQVNLADAVRGTIRLVTPQHVYRIGDSPATLVVRPRGWHLVEKHFRVDGEAISAGLFDFGLYLFHNGRETLSRGFGPYLYLPKLEGRLEARLWNEVASFAEDDLGLDRGSIRATVLVETITAAFEMDEILWELGPHACGLNAGRWDYIFSVAKKFREDPAFVLPDRSQVTMTTPFMRSYSRLLVKTCHRRGAHAIGGMSAFIPNRRDPEVKAAALARVREDKRHEAGDGFDGTWVAHPDLVATAADEFETVLGDRPNQIDRQLSDVVSPGDLLRVTMPEGGVTLAGLQTNVSVGMRYLVSWLDGAGAAAIDNLMEDAATAEISRAQVWQWIRHRVHLAGPDRALVTRELVRSMLNRTAAELVTTGQSRDRIAAARSVFEAVALVDEFPAFLTLPAYDLIP